MKNAVVPTVVAHAAEVLVVGSLARESMRARGVPDDRISVVANTVDVARLAEAADALAPRRDALRAEAGIDADDSGAGAGFERRKPARSSSAKTE